MQKYILGADIGNDCAMIMPIDELGCTGDWQRYNAGIICKAEDVEAALAAKDAEISDLKMRLDDARRVSDLWAKRCLDIEAAYTGGSCEHCFRGFTDPGEPCNHCNPPHPDTARLEKLPEIFNKLIFTDGWWWSQVTQQKYNTVREAIDAHQEPNNGTL